jgi:hypothetical protein
MASRYSELPARVHTDCIAEAILEYHYSKKNGIQQIFPGGFSYFTKSKVSLFARIAMTATMSMKR